MALSASHILSEEGCRSDTCKEIRCKFCSYGGRSVRREDAMLTAAYRNVWEILAMIIDKFEGVEGGIKRMCLPVKNDSDLIDLVDEAVDEWINAEYPEHVNQ